MGTFSLFSKMEETFEKKLIVTVLSTPSIPLQLDVLN